MTWNVKRNLDSTTLTYCDPDYHQNLKVFPRPFWNLSAEFWVE